MNANTLAKSVEEVEQILSELIEMVNTRRDHLVAKLAKPGTDAGAGLEWCYPLSSDPVV